MENLALIALIDEEIERLCCVRDALKDLATPDAPKRVKGRRVSKGVAVAVPSSEPQLIRLPPKIKREYRPRQKPTIAVAKALAAPISNRPVFVPRRESSNSRPVASQPDTSTFEAAVRQHFLSGRT